MRGVKSDSDHVRHDSCPQCGAPVLRALAGRIVALDVRADPWSVPAAQEAAVRVQGRLTWCLLTPASGNAQRLLWRDPEHVKSGKCVHTVLADHQCAGQAPVRSGWWA